MRFAGKKFAKVSFIVTVCCKSSCKVTFEKFLACGHGVEVCGAEILKSQLYSRYIWLQADFRKNSCI